MKLYEVSYPYNNNKSVVCSVIVQAETANKAAEWLNAYKGITTATAKPAKVVKDCQTIYTSNY